MFAALRQAIRSNRRAAPFRLLASAADKYLRAYHNDGFYEFDRNGERFALSSFAAWNGNAETVIWDVGAHDGEWAETAHRMIPAARITSFEILPPIAERLRARNFDPQWFTLENVGLSDSDGEVEVSWNHSHDSTNAITPRSGGRWFEGADVERVSCRTTTIDSYLATGKVSPRLLKIDTEGHDAAVLDGAAGLLSGPDAPAMIQFEYGETWLPARRTLGEVQARLESFGYAVGRLFPDHVAFKPYELADDHFRMGNMIATRDDRLRRVLAA
ncbi:FkbM family methyltransferase [Sphingomonas sp. MAH-20]|uniref:FkbM family methyltransferase n=1 Tax=Sphingomonas horti TaxID=2682842 RepID=A0A6I4J121_9SPHN|nr:MULTISPECIES: FkbM family methyltransferase [Sphingomonas]MBA2919399.1 FkbM family methyltransferase [Sphingomonas sp. CGMCC 1.13658]MVO78280.1 FkbM family methyltransferase [Sphingomonas horti]